MSDVTKGDTVGFQSTSVAWQALVHAHAIP